MHRDELGILKSLLKTLKSIYDLETQLDRLDSIRLRDIGISENVNVVIPQASNFEELMDLIDFFSTCLGKFKTYYSSIFEDL